LTGDFELDMSSVNLRSRMGNWMNTFMVVVVIVINFFSMSAVDNAKKIHVNWIIHWTAGLITLETSHEDFTSEKTDGKTLAHKKNKWRYILKSRYNLLSIHLRELNDAPSIVIFQHHCTFLCSAIISYLHTIQYMRHRGECVSHIFWWNYTFSFFEI
jgi:hypothetical protein